MKTLSNACLIQIQFDYGLISTRHERGGVFCNHLARKTLAGYFFLLKAHLGDESPHLNRLPIDAGQAGAWYREFGSRSDCIVQINWVQSKTAGRQHYYMANLEHQRSTAGL